MIVMHMKILNKQNLDIQLVWDPITETSSLFMNLTPNVCTCETEIKCESPCQTILALCKK